MGFPTHGVFEYRDKKLGDVEPIAVTTRSDVFYPTSTTVLLLRAARGLALKAPRSVLDLGCGSGVVAIALAKEFGSNCAIHASDLSPAAVSVTRENAQQHGLSIDCRCGNLFEPWTGHRFDLIVDDVSAVAEPLARSSPWYPAEVPSEAGRDGTRWILQVIDQTPEFLTNGGCLVFPVLTLAREDTVIARARVNFRQVKQLEEQWYPLTEELLAQFPLLEQLAAEGCVRLEKRGSRWWWATMIYVASS